MDRQELRRRIAQHPSSVRADELFGLLEAYGWVLRRIQSSHHVFVRGSERLSVPVHKAQVRLVYVKQVLALTEGDDDDDGS